MEWTKVKKCHIQAAIEKFKREDYVYPEPQSYYLLYGGELLPSKFIRGLAYTIATGKKADFRKFNGGKDTVKFFEKHGYTVINLAEKQEDRFTVQDAVWIATALMSVEKYDNNPNVAHDDMYFKQSDIQHRAETLVKAKVDSARISWWGTADNSEARRNYLRADLPDSKARRLSMMDEFPSHSYPVDLDRAEKLVMNGRPYTVGELFTFVRDVYPKILQRDKVEVVEENTLELHRIYRHFKGDYYLVEDIATDSETGAAMVIYRKLYGDGSLWVRPLSMFLEEVDHEKYPDVKQKYRFELQEIKSVNDK